MPLYGEKKREYQRNWLRQRRLSFIESKGGYCSKCGSKQNLEIDHIDRSDKLFNPTKLWSRNSNFRASELAKCQVLCKKCHLKKTKLEREK